MRRHTVLSYSRDELQTARELRKRLSRAGIIVWMDESDLQISEDWRNAIRSAIQSSQAMVVAMSPSAKASEYVNEEIDIAFEASVPIFPLLVYGRESTAVPPRLERIQYYDATGKKLGSGIKRLTVVLYDYAGIRNRWRSMQRWLWLAVALCVALAALTGFEFLQTLRKPPPAISLMSASYKAADYDPHVIDFRNAAEDGIPIGGGQSLQIFDLWISASASSSDFQMQVVVKVDGERIGSTKPQAIQQGLSSVGAMSPERYGFPENASAVTFNPNWKMLDLIPTIIRNGEVVSENHFRVAFNPAGSSQLQKLPLASLVSVVYTVNGGSEQLLDMRFLDQKGIDAHVGDQLSLTDVWYSTGNTGGSMIRNRISVSAYLTPDGYDDVMDKTADYVEMFKGIHRLTPGFTWAVRPSDKLWVISLQRDDDALLDRLFIPIVAIE